MAYSDLQEKTNQVRMNNSVLLAEKYSQGNLFPRGSDERPYSKEPRAEGARKKKQFKKDQEAKKKAKEVSDNARQRERDARKKRGEVFGDMPPDFNLMETLGPSLNKLLQIGGAAGSMIPFMGGNMLKMLIGGPKVMAGAPNFPGGGYSSTSGAFVDLSGEAYFLINGELIPQGGYDPAKHGDLIPHGGPDIPQAMNNQDMTIAGIVGYPHSNVQIDTGEDITTGETYKRVLPNYGAGRIKFPVRPKKL